MQIAIINFEKNYIEVYIQRNNKRNVLTIIFGANINVDTQNNFNYMKDDFVNQKRNDSERDCDNQKNINIDLIFKMCYNCDLFKHLFNVCIEFHVFDFVSTS